jgi:hypothetical protein
MKPATAEVRIKRPPAMVRELVADLSRHTEYLDHFLVDWEITSPVSRGVGATARLRAKGGGSDDRIEVAITAVTDETIVLESRSGRNRRMRLAYTFGEPHPPAKPPDAPGTVTQVTLRLDLLQGSVVDQATWALPRAHLERMYGQALLRLKGLVEGEPRSL